MLIMEMLIMDGRAFQQIDALMLVGPTTQIAHHADRALHCALFRKRI
jgi:hypothetical protein